jgi:hypothetical protein
MVSTEESSRDGRQPFGSSPEEMPPFFMLLVFFLLRAPVYFLFLRKNPLGRMLCC